MTRELPYAFAKFVRADAPLGVERVDTRLYFHRALNRTEREGTCVGSFWLQNPGSARYDLATQPYGDFAPLKTDPLMKHLRNVLDAVLRQTTVPKNAYVEVLNVHYFSDVKDGPKGKEIVAKISPQEICKHGISPTSKFLVLGLGKGWAAQYSSRVADAIVARGSRISIITPDGHQAKPQELQVRRAKWEGNQGKPTIPHSIFPNPIGAKKSWKEAYVKRTAAEIVASLKQ